MLTTSWQMQTAKEIYFGLVLQLLQVFQKHPIILITQDTTYCSLVRACKRTAKRHKVPIQLYQGTKQFYIQSICILYPGV